MSKDKASLSVKGANASIDQDVEAYLEVRTSDEEIIFSVEPPNIIKWRKDGELQIVETDGDLVEAVAAMVLDWKRNWEIQKAVKSS